MSAHDAKKSGAATEAPSDSSSTPPVQLPLPTFTPPSAGEMITSGESGVTYRIGAPIAEGFFSFVYECKDDWDNSLVAKVLKPRNRPYDEIRGAAAVELNNLRTARHPYITYIHDAFEFRDTFYIITERCTRSLHEMWTVEGYDGRVWITPIARCLLQAVDFIHNQHIAHQDIHPGNVFLNFITDSVLREQTATNFKLGDLGLAKLAHELDPTSTLAEWMRPPEAIDPAAFGPMDQRVDIYHCGLLLMQVLLGKPIQFSREQILEGAPRELALTLEPPYSAALEKTLRRHVMYRTTSAKELWRDLRSPRPDTTS